MKLTIVNFRYSKKKNLVFHILVIFVFFFVQASRNDDNERSVAQEPSAVSPEGSHVWPTEIRAKRAVFPTHSSSGSNVFPKSSPIRLRSHKVEGILIN